MDFLPKFFVYCNGNLKAQFLFKRKYSKAHFLANQESQFTWPETFASFTEKHP